MLDPGSLIAAASLGLTQFITQFTRDVSAKLIDDCGTGIAVVQFELQEASKKYTERYSKRHGLISVLDMLKPIALDDIYTPVQLLDKAIFGGYATEEDCNEARKNHRLRDQEDSKPGLDIVNEESCLMVLGHPGAGKTTFLRKMGLESLRSLGNKQSGEFKHHCIPVFVELKRIDPEQINLESIIINEFRTCGFPDSEKLVLALLEKGKMLVLLDGIDEIPTKFLIKAIRNTQDFADRYLKNRFIASCRTAAYHNYLPHFTHVAIAGFNNAQIECFIRKWFQANPEIANQCWELLKYEENVAIKELAQTPLLLTFICLVYQHDRRISKNRCELYDRALDIFLENWTKEKLVEQEQIYSGLHTDLEKAMLSEIAYSQFSDGHIVFTGEEISQQITTFLAETLGAPKHLDSKAVLEAIEVQQGLLVQESDHVYSFVHLSFQEYLTALYIHEHSLADQLVSEHLLDRNWREVFFVISGLLKGSVDSWLLNIEEQIHCLLTTERLRKLIQWADDITDVSHINCKPVAKRAFAIVFALSSILARHLDTSEDFSETILTNFSSSLNIAHALANSIDLKFAADLEIDIVEDEQLAHDIGIDCTQSSRLGHRSLTRLVRCLSLFEIMDRKELDLRPLRNWETMKIFKPSLDLPAIDRVKIFYKCKYAPHDIVGQIYNNLNITCDLLHLSEEELIILTDYLYANFVMVSCQKLAIRVLRQTWEAIETRMLTNSSPTTSETA